MGKKKIRFKQGRIAYPGSWLTQNFGENAPKGVLLWDTEKKTSRFIELPNKFAFLTKRFDTFEDCVNHIESTTYDSCNRLRFIVSSVLSPSQEEEIEIRAIKQYSLKENPVVISGDITKNITIDERDVSALYTSKEFQLEKLKTYVEDCGYGEDYYNECEKIHLDCYANVQFPDYNSTHFKIEKLSFSNIGAYAEDNVIDFRNERGIIGLFAANRSGKSTILETLSFAIFGKTIKEINTGDLINLNQKKASTEISLVLNGERFKILRTLKRTKTGASSTVSFEKESDNGTWISLNAEDVKLTNKLIERYFGSHDDLLISSLASQEDLLGLLRSKQADRLKTLYRFIGLHFYEDLLKVAKKQFDEKVKELEVVQKTNNSQAYSALENKKQGTERAIKENETRYTTLKSTIKETTDKVNELSKDIKQDVQNTIDIVALRKELDVVKKDIANNSSTLERNRNTIERESTTLQILREDVITKLRGNKYDATMEKLPMVQQTNKLLQEANNSIKILEGKEKSAKRAVEILSKHDWFETNENCKQCTFLSDAWSHKAEIESIENELLGFKNKYEENKELLSTYGFTEQEILVIQKKASELKDLKNDIDKLKLSNETIEKTLENLEMRKSQIEKEVESNKEILEILEKNKELSDSLNSLSNLKERSEREMKSVEEDIWKHKTELAKIEGQLKNIEEKLLEIISLESQVKYYKVYIDAVSKNGIPFEIIRSILPSINNEINATLSQTQDWKIQIVADKENLKINIIDNIVGKECARPIESASGAERGLSSLATRFALLKLSYLPKSNFFIIDEGFGSLDAENVIKVKAFLGHLKQYFDSIILISHVPQMVDMVDKQWEISRDEAGYSKILIN